MQKPEAQTKAGCAGAQVPRMPQIPIEPREPRAYPAYPRRPANISRTTVKIVTSEPHYPGPKPA